MAYYAVATREGGVDRNMCAGIRQPFGYSVATREGGVDRNFNTQTISVGQMCRHPRGWRG